jgi:hypothetical protein
VHRHVLSGTAFTELAAGRPNAETVAELGRAEYSRRLLLLRGLVRAAPTTTAQGYADLAAAERRDPAATQAMLAYPLVGVWVTGCLAALRAGVPEAESGAGRLGELATGPAPHRLTAEHHGLRLDVALDDVDPARSRLGLTPTDRLTADEVDRWSERLGAAWRLLVARHRPYAETIAGVLRCIVPVEPDGTARGISATSAQAYGAVALSFPADPTAMAVGLLHETQHSLLNAVHHLFDLHDSSPALGYSPWRDDPRPASGLLHGAYAYLGVTDFWRVERRSGAEVAAFEFARWRDAVTTATESLLAGSALTVPGARFVAAMREQAESWRSEQVPPEVQRRAEEANAAHHARWLAANVDPDGRVIPSPRRRLPPG